MWWRAGVAGVGFVLLLCAPAGAALPMPGGRYATGPRHQGTMIVRVKLTLANDGKEFVAPSKISVELIPCANHSFLSTFADLDNDGEGSVRVGRRGRFRLSQVSHIYRVLGASQSLRLSGAFLARGRRVGGRGSYEDRYAGCRVRGTFSARLMGTPNATQPGALVACEPVRVEPKLDSILVDPVEQGVGCTPARVLAMRWYKSPGCRGVPLGSACRVAGHPCTTVRGDPSSPLASVHCTFGSGSTTGVSLIYRLACTRASPTILVWAINVGCEVAARLDFDPRAGCGDGPGAPPAPGDGGTCYVSGYTCTLVPGVYKIVDARCIADADPHVGIDLESYP
jgi:hypothetical protein